VVLTRAAKSAGRWHIRCSDAGGMKCDNATEVESPPAPVCCDIRLPMGILGFEQIKDYLLISNPVEEPFRWLRVKEDPSLAFVVIEPFLALPDYCPDIPQADVEFLGLQAPGDAVLYNIVTVHSREHATVNLKGPVVINRNTGVGKQVIIANAAQYSVQHPLPAAEPAV
jgi:flagellar assembly factor FliW